jgi:hypothetical protein
MLMNNPGDRVVECEGALVVTEEVEDLVVAEGDLVAHFFSDSTYNGTETFLMENLMNLLIFSLDKLYFFLTITS